MAARPPYYLANEFAPCASMGDTLCLIGSTGPYVKGGAAPTPFYQIQYIEPIRGVGGPHGLCLLWTHSTTAPSGYALVTGATSGQLAAGAATRSQPVTTQMPTNELLQFRFTLHLLGGGAGGNPVVDDFDVQVYLPSAIGRWQVLNDQGRYNAMPQFPLPGDDVTLPAQGSNLTPASAFPLAHPAQHGNFNEFFVFENQNYPVFGITNNGSGNTAAGMALGIMIWGWRYVLNPLSADTTWTNQNILGYGQQQAPPNWLPVPIGGRGR